MRKLIDRIEKELGTEKTMGLIMAGAFKAVQKNSEVVRTFSREDEEVHPGTIDMTKVDEMLFDWMDEKEDEGLEEADVTKAEIEKAKKMIEEG